MEWLRRESFSLAIRFRFAKTIPLTFYLGSGTLYFRGSELVTCLSQQGTWMSPKSQRTIQQWISRAPFRPYRSLTTDLWIDTSDRPSRILRYTPFITFDSLERLLNDLGPDALLFSTWLQSVMREPLQIQEDSQTGETYFSPVENKVMDFQFQNLSELFQCALCFYSS